VRWLRRLSYWLRFDARADDLRDELDTHRQLLADDFRRRGLSPADADAAARRTLGNDTYMREEARAVWLAPRLDAIVKDWRYAWRGLRRSPAFTLVAISSLALGIGANTAIFSLIHALLLARVPVPGANELVEVRRDLGAKGTDERLSHGEFTALATGPIPLSMFVSSGASVELDGIAVNVSLDAVDGRYFDLLGLHAQRGRLIAPNDDRGDSPVAVITDRFWRGRMNADPDVVGKRVSIEHHPFTIVGVMPEHFAGLRFPSQTDVAIPYTTAASLGLFHIADARRPAVTVFGRRPSSMPIERARVNLAATWEHCCVTGDLVALPAVQASIRSTLDLIDVSRGIPQVKLDVRGQYSRVLLALMAGVAILLLAACANVANLLLARSSARAGELAVRLALGASRSRLVLQLVIESLQLSLLGAGAGLLLARWSAALLRGKIGDLSGVLPSNIGASVLAFTVTVSVVSGIVFGVIPAVRVMNTDLIAPLKQGGRRSSSGRRGMLDRALVALQMALALLLVSGASLLVQTLRNLQQADLGFDPSHRIALNVETRRTSYERQGMTVRMADDMLGRVRTLPGVGSAAFASFVPVFGGRGVSDIVTTHGGATISGDDAMTWFTAVTPGYFDTMGMTLLAGRDIGAQDAGASRTATRDVVINEAFAKKFFPGRNSLGQSFRDADDGSNDATENRIVGIVANTKFRGLRTPAEPMYYVPVADGDFPFLVLVVRPRRNATGLAPWMGRAITAVAPGIAVGDATLLSASIDAALSRERMSAALATLFGAIALSLVAVGLYGVMLYQVAERTPEIGIRMALGARASSIVRLVLGQSLAVVGLGLVAGVPLAMLAGRAVASQLYGVAPYSPWALTIAASSLVAVAIVASLVPVRRAIGVDPLTALRAE